MSDTLWTYFFAIIMTVRKTYPYFIHNTLGRPGKGPPTPSKIMASASAEAFLLHAKPFLILLCVLVDERYSIFYRIEYGGIYFIIILCLTLG